MNTFRGVGLDEARFIPAGVYHWRHGEFALASDCPPLARMIAALPLLPLEVHLPYYRDGDKGVEASADARDRELGYGGRFASGGGDRRWYELFCLARTAGFLWWMLGAWVIRRWSGELYGVQAGSLALTLWCVSPNVLAFEQQVTPELPLAVTWAVACYSYRGYLRTPSWERALVSGLLLGVAQLFGFVSLALFVIWPLVAFSRRLARGGGTSTAVEPHARMLHAVFAVCSCLWVINVGYGFSGSGPSLGRLDFVSRALGGDSPTPGEPVASRAAGNRFRGTWLGRVVCPVPADYLRGLDRILDGRENDSPPRGNEEWPVQAGDSPLASAGDRRPIGLWGMMLGSLILLVARHPSSAPLADELALWLPLGALLYMTASSIGPSSTAAGILLTIPFGIVMASKLACLWRSGRRGIGWVAALLSLWAIADGLNAIYVDQITPENRARFRIDLGKQLRRVGLPALAGRIDAGSAGEYGLLYRNFVDSRGVGVNYALYVPRGYRGDRPYPLIFFLHGHGDRGTSGRQFAAVGLPFTLGYREIDFLVLCPQGRSGSWEPGGDDARRALELLAAIEEEYRVDPVRISLIGLSSGGTGVWDLAAEYPARWAAIVPVASAPRDPGQAPLIKDIPCWCFHNRYDGGSPATKVRRMIEALRAVGGRPRYTEFLDINHNAGNQAFILPELFDWLSQQRRP